MKKIINNIQLNIDKKNYINLFAKQEDDLELNIIVLKDGSPFSVANQTCKIFGLRSNKSIVEQRDGITISNENITILLKNSFTYVAGKVELDIEFTDSSGKSTSASFFITVDESVTGENNVNATSEVTALEKAKESAEEVLEKLEDINSIASEVETKERERQINEIERNSSENIRIVNENTRINAENSRKENEDYRIKSENNRKQQFDEALYKVNNLFEATKDNDLNNTIASEVIGGRGVYNSLGTRLEHITTTLNEYGEITGSGKLDTESKTIINAINEIFAYIRTIPVELKGISLDPIEIPMYIGDNKKINVIYTPVSATNKNVIWESSSNAIASIDSNGNVIGRGVGNCTITVTSEEGNFIAKANVSVTEKETVVNIFKIGLDNATNYLDLPIEVNNDTDVVHPSVLYFENGWNGYKYWMAINPYPKTQSSFENPWLLKSNSPDSGWELAHDGPIYGIPTGAVHNSDCHIFMDKNETTMHYINRPSTNNGCFIEYFSTTDGATFTERKTIIGEIEGHNYLSPSVCIYNNKYYMFVIDTAKPSVVTVLEATNLEDEWMKVNEIIVPSCDKFWHGEVKWVNEEFIAIITSGDAQGGQLHIGKFATPFDASMTTRTTPIFSTIGEFGSSALYKCSFIVDENLDLGLFYGTKTGRLDITTDWRVAYTKAKKLIPTFKIPNDYDLVLSSDDGSIFNNNISELMLADLPSHNFIYESVVNNKDIQLLFRTDNTTDILQFANETDRTKIKHIKGGNVINTSNSYLSIEDYNKVSIVGNDTNIKVYINDMLVSQIEDQSDDYKENRVGFKNGDFNSLSNVKIYVPSSENYTSEKATTYYNELWSEYEKSPTNFLLVDKFERDNSSDIGVSLDGKIWSSPSGCRIENNKLKFTNAQSRATVNVNSSKYSIVCKLAEAYNYHCLYAKYIDSSNYIRLVAQMNNGAKVEICQNSVITTYSGDYTPYNLTDGFLRIDCINNMYSFYMNNKPIIENLQIDGFDDNSICGLGSTGLINPSFDGVIVKKI